MRTRILARLGVMAAATTLASAAALTGAAVATAQTDQPTVEFDGPSSLSVSGAGALTTVTYQNRSGYDLACEIYLGPSQLIEDFYDLHRVPPGESAEKAVMEKIDQAADEGRFGAYTLLVEDGQSTVADAHTDNPEGAVPLTDSSLIPAAMAICYGVGENGEADHIELELASNSDLQEEPGSPGGSVGDLGNVGSMTQLTGSLGG